MTPGLDLARRVAVVTGAGSPTGIGFAVCRRLGELGASVALTGTSDRVHERAEELERLGVPAMALVADLTDPSAADDLVAAVEGRWGRLDVLVNNAGMVAVADDSASSGDESRQGEVVPLGRSGSADEVAWPVAWLCTPGAAYVTGQCLVVDGGNAVAEERQV